VRYILIKTTIQLTHFDMAGTTIDDEVGNTSEEFEGKPLPIMIDGFQYGLAKIGVVASFNDINKHRGAKKLDALYDIVTELSPEIISNNERWQMARQAHEHFIQRGIELAERIQAKTGVLDLFQKLKDKGVYVIVATGFPNEITDALITNLGWLDRDYVDLVVNAEQAGGGRPAPNMINFALRSAGLLVIPDSDLGKIHSDFNYSIVMKVGDTSKDVEEGLKAGALTIATLEGTQSLEEITSKGQPDYIVKHTRDIIGLVDSGKIALKPINPNIRLSLR
jgi:phosphoglycolate phosphatase-like HAD superfamily hydrolase